MSTDPFVELRGEVDRDIIDVIDAVAQSERSNRMTVVRRWLQERVDDEVHRSTLILRVRNGNGTVLEAERKRASNAAEADRKQGGN